MIQHSLFVSVQSSIYHHWIRWGLGAEQAPSHYLNQRWHILLTHICVTRIKLLHTKSFSFQRNVQNMSILQSVLLLLVVIFTCWRHQMETFSALLAICAGISPVPGEFPAQRPVTRSFDVFFDLCLNKRPSKQWWGWWFETLSGPLWRHCNELGPRLYMEWALGSINSSWPSNVTVRY